MKNFSLLFPRKIIFGNGKIYELKNIDIPYKKGMLVTGKNFAKKTGLIEKIKSLLPDKELIIFSNVEPEVSVETVDIVARIARAEKIDFIIGLGGGSALDCAKAVAGIYKENYSVKDYLDNKVKITKEPAFFIAIPTTAGTGSEVTRNAVLNYTEKDLKISLRSEKLIPDVVIADPELTITMPDTITAFTGMDALCHAVESFFSINANDFTKALAKKSIKIILENLYKAYKNGKNINARENMLYASLLAGFSFSNAGLGAVHGISHPIGAILKLPHGLLNAFLLPYVLEFNKKVIKKELKNLEKDLNCNLIQSIKNLNKKMKISEHLKNIQQGIKNNFDYIISKMEFNSGSMSYNPVKMNRTNVKKILKEII